MQNLVIEEGQPLTFTASFDVVPSFDPGDFSTIEVRRQPVTVDEEAVDPGTRAVARSRRPLRAGRRDGVVEAGQTAVLDWCARARRQGRPRGEEDRHDQVSIELGASANPPASTSRSRA
jgi:FKBP-type peptidyl-prolyl cis-trans isomerase (trigger factor)